MGFFSLYIIIMSQDDYDDLYDDDVNMLEVNKNLPSTGARVEMEEDAMSKAVGEKLYGPTGRGSPEMRNISPYELSRNSGKALRNEGIKDSRHLENTKAWDTKTEQQKKEEADDARLDAYLDNMYKNMYKEEMKRPVDRSKAKSPSQKGGTRKRARRRSKKSSKKRSTRRNKRSRKGRK